MKQEPQKPAFEGEVFNLLFLVGNLTAAYKSTDPADIDRYPESPSRLWFTRLNSQALKTFFPSFTILPISQLQLTN